MQSAIAAAWAYQDCERPLYLFDKLGAKVNLLKQQVIEAEKKLAAKKEELKANEVELVGKVEKLEKAWAEVRQRGGERTRLYEEVRSLRPQLEQVKAATAKAVSEFQASQETVVTKKSSYEEGLEASVWAFTYTVVTKCLDQDLAFLGEKLIDQVATWHAQWQASLFPVDEPSASLPTEVPTPLSIEASVVPPPLEVHHEQVIEDDTVVRVDESDGSGDDVEQINNPDSVLDCQEE